jgi:ADP-heptose:LPS heptosyltransferase/SAM-dependent methyltransferase
MYETSKAVQRRLHDTNFVSRYFRGNGIDIGSGNDQLGQYIELFPLMESCKSWDRADGDAEHMAGVKDASYDFVHSSHCLEDMHSPDTALKNWFRILKPGGHLIVTVPDEDMYEQGVWPSTFNAAHKWTFTIYKLTSWSQKSRNLFHALELLGDEADVIKIEQLTGTYRYGLDRQDQTRAPIGEAAIEFIIRKRSAVEKKIGGHGAVSNEKKLPRIKPAIALHRPGAIGDIIMTLSLVPLLQAKYPEHEIHYFCNGTIGQSLVTLMQKAGVTRGFNTETLAEKRGNYEKVIDLVGYPLHEGYPEKPMKKHLTEYFAAEMGIKLANNYFGVPHLTLDAGKYPFPDLVRRYATIHPQAGWSVYKNWEQEKWERIISARSDIPFFQIGSAGDSRLRGADHSFMGEELDKSIDLMAHATLHLGVDSWTNHLTNIEWRGPVDDTGDYTFQRFTPAIILWGSTQASAAGYERNTNISLGLKCQPCFREDPKISRMPRGPCINPPGQDYAHPKHACMNGITVTHVIDQIEALWPTGLPTRSSSMS